MQNLQSQIADINNSAHICSVKPRNAADEELFSEIGKILKKYNAEDRFGVTLLHKHFDIGDDETLVEYTNEELRIQKIVVEKNKEANCKDTIETSWSLKDGQVFMRCQCIIQGKDHNHQSTK